MATNKEHNDLIKVVFNGNKHLNHVLADKEIRQMTMIEGHWPISKSPVCGHCERLGMWSKDSITGLPCGVCRSCGTITKKPVTYSTYLASGYDVDPTGATFRNMDLKTRKKDQVNRCIYLPNLRRLEV